MTLNLKSVGRGSADIILKPTSIGILVGNGPDPITTISVPAGGLVGTTATQTLTNKTIEEIVWTSSLGAAYTVSVANGTIQRLTLTTSTTITFPAASANAGRSVNFVISTGGNSLTWSGVRWPSGAAPTLSGTSPSIVSALCDGVYWYNTLVGSGYL